MAPKKKGEKMSLNAFLEDSTLGSWADEMDSLPTAPAPRQDDGLGDSRDYGRRGGDYLSSRPDRGPAPQRDDVPLPTQPPYTAFIGNLAFDLTEGELGSFFGPHETKSVKIIRDREDKPKGFGYVEFADLEGLKAALDKNGASFSNRSIRVNVAEPQKDRAGGFGGGDDDKFSGNWRRDGPLPDLPGRGGDRDGPGRRRYEGISSESTRESASDGISDWRSSRPPARFTAEPDLPPVRRKGSGFSTPSHEGEMSPADAEEKWTIGGKFKPSGPSPESTPGSRFGSLRGRGDMGPPSSAPSDDAGGWRRGPPAKSTSPTTSVPSTPQMGRRKLELLPRSSNPSAQPTPLSSPKAAVHQTSKTNPFGAAKPVDVTAREAAVLEKIEKEREEVSQRVATQHSMSRHSSRQARSRAADGSEAAPASAGSPTATTPSSPRVAPATVRPAFSFAAAAAKKDAGTPSTDAAAAEDTPAPSEDSLVDNATEKLSEVTV